MDTPGVSSGLSVTGLVKDFGGVRALNGANFAAAPSTIHGLVGQNGAGKSTLIKILAGLHQPNAGTIKINDVVYPRLNPALSERLGLQFIHQERLLVPTFTVAEALFLGSESRIGPFVDRRTMERQSVSALRHYFGLAIPPKTLIGQLSAAQQQTVQITRALLRKPSVLVLDEPTAALVKPEVDLLFRTLRRLRDDGLTIIYISHYLNEIETLCDQVTILRNGVDVGTVEPRKTSLTSIVSLMVDRNIEDLFRKRSPSIGEPVLQATNLSHRTAFSNVSFTLHRGEILGVTGLIGSGAKEMVRSLFGLEKLARGQLHIDGRSVRLYGPSSAVRRRLALVPEDRRQHGVALTLTVRENLTLASLPDYGRAGIVSKTRERRGAKEIIRQLSLRTPDEETPVRKLSGGNQQKVALGKWLSRQSAVYVLDEPTVGVDIGAKIEIYRIIGDLVARGAGVLLLSSDLLELLGLADRILVFFRGEITTEFASGEADSDTLLTAVTGVGDPVGNSVLQDA